MKTGAKRSSSLKLKPLFKYFKRFFEIFFSHSETICRKLIIIDEFSLRFLLKQLFNNI